MTTLELEHYVHRKLRFEIDLPVGLQTRTDLRGIALAAWDPQGTPATPFHTNLTVVAEQLPEPFELPAYADRSLATQADVLLRWHLFDREETDIGGIPAVRTLGHHSDGELAIVAEQWRLIHDGRGWVLTASCGALDYPGAGDIWRAVAETFRPRGSGA